MNDQRIAILTDTGTNVPADFAATHDVRNVSLVVNYSDGSFRSGIDITTDEVIDRFETEIPTTSLPSPSDIQAALEAARADGYERAVFVTISSGLSATNQTVELVALADVGRDGDDLRIVVIFLQPGNDDGRIETARVGQNDFLDLALIHD